MGPLAREPRPVPEPPGPGRRAAGFPRPPAYAWAWFQRSRPVLHETAVRLTGAPPSPGFVARLRREFVTDPFVRDVVVAVVAEVAFNGRVPARRPAGSPWDRGLVWWAAAIAGVAPAEFERRPVGPPATEPRLFDTVGVDQPAGGDRAYLAARLRELIDASDGDQVPVAAVRDLLAELERLAAPPAP